jgi:vacuolar protein sorting-associated protein 35
MQYTLPPIVFEAYRLAFRFKNASSSDEKWDKKCDKIFRMCFQIINSLIKAEIQAELAFKLFLEGSIALAEIAYDNSENITYEFLTQVRVSLSL